MSLRDNECQLWLQSKSIILFGQKYVGKKKQISHHGKKSLPPALRRQKWEMPKRDKDKVKSSSTDTPADRESGHISPPEQVSMQPAWPTDSCSCFHGQMRTVFAGCTSLRFVENRPHKSMKCTASIKLTLPPCQVRFSQLVQQHDRLRTVFPRYRGTMLNAYFYDDLTGIHETEMSHET